MNGLRPDIDVQYWDTIAPFLLKDVVGALEEGIDPATLNDLSYAIQETYWPNIDIIPACMELLRIDLELPEITKRLALAYSEEHPGESKAPDHIEYLRKGIATVSQDYDFVLLDGTPSLNLSTMNVVTACDVTFIPAPAQMSDYASTLQFTNLITQTIEAYQRVDYHPPMPDIFYCITKFSDSPYSDWMGKMIRKTFGDRTLRQEAHNSDEIGKAGNKIKSIYEINQSESNNRQLLKVTRAKYDSLFNEMLEEILLPIWQFDEEDADEKPASGMAELLEKEGLI